MSLVDLHIHSNASDGKHSPSEIVRRAASLGLKIIALSDHDTIDGIPEALNAARSFPGLTVIPGVEISTDVSGGEVHILGYFIDHTDPDLVSVLGRMRNSRVERARKMVSKLAALGVKIEWERVKEIAADSTLGRPHIAQAMQEKGYIRSFNEAFDRYIGHGGPAYVERDKMLPSEAVQLIVRSGGLPVFAHPVTFPGYQSMTLELLSAGLVGIEVYYKNSTPEEIRKTRELADKYGLIPTGGSDYHGIDPNEVDIGGVAVPLESAKRLIARAEKHGTKGGN